VNLKAIKNVVTSKVGRQLLTVQKHSPAILFGAGVVGVVTTVVLASRATLKLDDILAEAQEDLEKVRTLEHADYSEEDRTRDKVIVYVRTGVKIVRIYGPAVVVGVASIAALTGAHVVLSRRNVAITAAYAALDKGFREYRQRVKDELGPDKDAQFRYGLTAREIVEETDEGTKVSTVIDVPGGVSIYAKVFDKTNRNWSNAHMHNQFFIQCQQNYANDLLRSRGHVFLNEVYDSLGMDRTKEGAVVGWLASDCEGDGYIDFGVFEGDRHSGMRFARGEENSIWLDFNVDGIIYDKI